MSERPKIVLGEEDFAEQPSPSLPPGPPSATVSAVRASPADQPAAPSSTTAALPTVVRGRPLDVDPRAVPGAGQSAPRAGAGGALGSNWLTDAGKTPFVAAALGVLLAWAVTEAFGIADFSTTSKTGSDAKSALWTGVIGIMFGGTLIAFDSAVAGVWEVAGRRFGRAAVPMFAVAFVAGFVGNAIYLQIVQGIFESALHGAAISTNDVRFYLARGLGWALFGAGIGTTIGLLNRSGRQAINGAIGGALGGAAGGVVFQFLSANLGTGNSTSRLIGLFGVGALIALATRAVETARREAWLQVLAGGMAGKEFILYHAVTRLGASPDCEIFLLKDPAVAKLHAQIEDRQSQRVLTTTSDAPLFVNQAPVTTHVLRHGDQLQLGQTVIGYSERRVTSSPGSGS